MAPNPHRDPVPWNRVRIGGRLIKAILTKFEGIKIEDGWKVDKGKASSGGAAKFTGTKLVESIKLTFKAAMPGPNRLAAAAEAFDDMLEIFILLAPIPGQGSGTAPKAAAGQTTAVGSPPAAAAPVTAEALLAQAQASLAALNSNTKTSTPGATASAASSATPDPDPGPRPPTLPIEFAPCALIGVFAIARKSFEIQYDDKSNCWIFILEVIQDKPPSPAGAGVMAAPKASGTNPGAAYSSGPATAPGAATSVAAGAAAAGT